MWLGLIALFELIGAHWLVTLFTVGGVSAGTYLAWVLNKLGKTKDRPRVVIASRQEHKGEVVVLSQTPGETITINEEVVESLRPENLGGDIKKSPERDPTAFSRSKDQQKGSDDASLNFRFDGPGYSNGALLRNAPVRLVCSDRHSETTHTTVIANKIDALKARDGSLVLVLTVPDGVELKSAQVAVAKFVASKLLDEIGFDIEVKDSSAAVVDFHIDLYSASKLLYGLPISIAVSSPGIEQPDRESALTPPRPLVVDLDAVIEDAPSTGLLLSMSAGIDGLSMTLIKNTSGAIDSLLTGRQPDLTAPAIQALLDQIRAELGADYFNPPAWKAAEPGHVDWMNDTDLRGCCERVASAGSILYLALCRSDPCRNILEYINAQPVGARLTVATSGVFLPLEIVYPRKFSKFSAPSERQQNPVAPEQFWGVRFALETLQSGPGDYREMRLRHWRAPVEVSFNLNSTITSEQKPDPMAMHLSFADRLQKEGVQCSVKEDCESMRETLLAAASTAGVIYVYCHGAGATPGAGAIELLQLDYNCFLRPVDFVSENQFASAPVIILNACLAGSTSPLMFNGFLAAFRAQGALGVIATTFYVPTLFGATFGAELVEACLVEGAPLSEKLRVLRQARAARGNLAPLFYSVQCQLDH